MNRYREERSNERTRKARAWQKARDEESYAKAVSLYTAIVVLRYLTRIGVNPGAYKGRGW